MELNSWTYGVLGALIGVLVGALIQYYLNRLLKRHELEIKAKSDLYLTLFSTLRDLGNDTIKIQSLLCDAQIYASDAVLDGLHGLQPDKPFSEKLLHDLLVVIRKELRPESKPRALKVFVFDPAIKKSTQESHPNRRTR